MPPPIISTTPNSPTVWVKASTAAVSRKGRTKGSNTRVRILTRSGRQQLCAASRISRSTERKPEVIGCTAKGRLKMTEPTRSPAKEKANG